MPSLTPRIPALDDLRSSLEWQLRPNRTLSVDDFFPLAGQPTERMVIHGHGFALARADNDVEVGGQPARVVHAEADRLVVLLDGATVTGPVRVTVGPDTATGPIDYEVLGPVGADEDGPPITFAGAGTGAAAGLPSTGTARVLVVLVAPSDTLPANPTQARQDVVDRWASVHTFYDQASYSKLNLQVDVTTGWTTLTGSAADYLYESGDTNFPNVDWNVMPRLTAEAARAAQDDSRNLNDYGMMAVVLNLNGSFIRAWGGWSAQNFSATDGNGVAINITASHAIDLLAIQESADWGRFAHETGHNVIDNPPSPGPIGATLGEDLYDSDLVDPSAATGQEFDIMGQHDHRPIFSAYHLKTLGWYKPENVTTVQWTRNAFSREFDVVAHALTQDTAADRFHIVEIRVTPSLSYYVEVRQRPGLTAQVFDPQIPLGSASHEGGVIVTKTISGTVNQNQQTRFITLLHDSRVLKQNESAIDPARDLKITVTNDNLQSRPLVCRVKIEWAQTVAGDPDGTFDLRVDPWDKSYQTPDIWVDRQPFGSFDQGFDSEGRPKGSGDKPRPKEINKLFARVHNDGITDAADVRVTLYVVTPPGVGDNGNWAPLQTITATSIAHADFKDVPVQWVPQVGEHTCLKVYAEKQFGEISTGNNSAQENVFAFEAPASSPPDPVLMPVAIRNPSPTERLPVAITVDRVPKGYTVHLDHQWVWLEPLGETQLELWVVPTEDVSHYIGEKRADPAPVRVTGRVPHNYKTAAGTTAAEPVGSVATRIGGITASVTPKHRGEIELREAGASNHQAFGSGVVKPGVRGTRVQIVAYGKNRSVGSGFAKTGANGFFSQEFRTFGPPAVKVQAFVVDADVVSECASNVLFV